MAALNKAVSSDWLNIDSKANVGTGTTPYTQAAPDAPPEKVPFVETGVAPENPTVVQDSGEFLNQPAAWTGNWPNVNASQGEWGRQLPIQRGQGAPQGQEYPRVQEPDGYNPRTNAYDNLNQYAGMDLRGDQDVSSNGWQNSYPSGRIAQRQRFGDSSQGVQNYWNPVAERPTPSRRALTAQPPVDGSGLPPNFYSPAGQNTAYTTPQPPPTTDAQPSGSVVDPLSGGWA